MTARHIRTISQFKMMMMMMMMFSLTHGPGEDAVTTLSEDQPYKQG